MQLDAYVAKTLEIELAEGATVDLNSKEVKEIIKTKVKAAEKQCKKYTFDKPTLT